MGTGLLQAGPLLEQIPHCGHFGLLLSDCPPGPGSADARKMDFCLEKELFQICTQALERKNRIRKSNCQRY